MAKFEVTIRYKDRKKKNKVVVVNCAPEFILDMKPHEVSITIKRLDPEIPKPREPQGK